MVRAGSRRRSALHHCGSVRQTPHGRARETPRRARTGEQEALRVLAVPALRGGGRRVRTAAAVPPPAPTAAHAGETTPAR